MTSYLKHPDARIDYAIDWAAAYLDGQTISQSQWQVAPDNAGGVTIASTTHDGARTAVTLEGGRAGQVYRISNRITLGDGRCDTRTLMLRVEAR